jgi:hypothetical protein
MPGLKPWERAYKRDWRYRRAFATSVVLDPQGNYPLGTSGSGHRNEAATAANYHPELYLQFLTDSKNRGRRLAAVQEDTTLRWGEKMRRIGELRSEIIQQLKDANSRGGWKRTKASAG